MSQGAEFLGTSLAVLLLALPLGLVVGIAGRSSWIVFWIVSLILIIISTLLFSNPQHHTGDDFLFTGTMAAFGILFDGLLVRAGLRALLQRWNRRQPSALS